MPLPRPELGLVIGYSYLWRAEADRGAEDARKSRLSAVIFVTADEGGRTVVMVLPITHRAPRRKADAVEIPAATKKRLGLAASGHGLSSPRRTSLSGPGRTSCP